MDPRVARLVKLERRVRKVDPEYADAILAFMEEFLRHLERRPKKNQKR